MNTRLFVLLAVAAVASASSITTRDVTSDINDLFDEFWTWRLSRSPEFATQTGSKEYNGRLEIFTKQRFLDDAVKCNEFLDRANTLMGQGPSEDQTLYLRLFKDILQTFIDGVPYNGFYFPVSYLEGVQVDFQKLIEWASFDTKEDYEMLIQRFASFHGYSIMVQAMLNQAITDGMTNNEHSMGGVLEQFRVHLGKDPKETVFYEPFKNLTGVVNATDATDLAQRAEAAIRDSVQVGFQNLHDYLDTTYLQNLRAGTGAYSLPSGEEFYNQCLKFHTSTEMTAEAIHTLGLQEVERIETEMNKIKDELGYNDMTLQEFTDMVRSNQSNYYQHPDDLLNGFKDIILNKIDGKILDVFKQKPQLPLEVVAVPPSMPDAPAAFYIAGTADGKRPGRFYVNTNKYGSQPKYEMISLALHESNPGHHLQGSYLLVQEDWPDFRRTIEDRIYSQTPSRFPINTAYTEGWGLYSESLGFDMGLYDDPLDRFGHYSEEIFRACRLVVDTGLHAKSWTPQQAVDYMKNHTAATEENIVSEVNRYITWPGQATAYKIGQINISQARSRAKNQLGDNFDIKEFHEVVLRSCGPVSIMQEEVDKYIDRNRPNSAHGLTHSTLLLAAAAVAYSLLA